MTNVMLEELFHPLLEEIISSIMIRIIAVIKTKDLSTKYLIILYLSLQDWIYLSEFIFESFPDSAL